MRKHRTWIGLAALAFALLSALPGMAQLSRYKVTRFTEADGLPASRVHRILADRFGYIWVGTLNGLARYDGYAFKRFYSNPNDSSSINGLIIWDIFEDRDGLIWVSAGVERLNIYDHASGGFRQLRYGHLVRRPANVEVGITKIIQDKTGRMYFAVTTNYGETIDDGLLYKEPGSDSLRRFPMPDGLRAQNVYRLATDPLGNTWFLSNQGLYRIDPDRRVTRVRDLDQVPRQPNEFAADMLFDDSGRLWILTNLGNLLEYTPDNGRYAIHKSLAPYPTTLMLPSMRLKGNTMLLATGGGFMSFDRATQKFDLYPPAAFPGNDQPLFDAIAEDPFGGIWLGSTAWGMFRLNEAPRFTSYTPNSPSPWTTAPGWAARIREDRDGQVWFVSNRDGAQATLNKLFLRSGEVQQIPMAGLMPGLNHISAFDVLPDGNLLLSTNLGLFHFDPDKKKISVHELPGFASQYLVNYFLLDSRENHWVASTGGLFRKARGAKTYSKVNYAHLPGFNASSDEVSFLLESRKHGLWMLTNNGLFLYQYDTDSVERHAYDPGKGQMLLTQDINSLGVDSSGIVWIGTWQGGLSRYIPETGEVKNYTQNDGLPSMSIQGIQVDSESGTLWLSTFDGLSRFDPRSGQFNNYAIDDGIQGLLFADGASVRTSSGHFVFGGSNGITIFHPGEILRDQSPPKVYLTSIRLFNTVLRPEAGGILTKPVYETDSITLAHNQNTIGLDFIALHYANPAKNRYAYMLENHDPDWREVSGQPEAFYAKLPPGKYVFRVRAANSNGIWNEEGIRLAITVLPPWWQTPWAYALYGLGVIGLGFLINLFFHRRLLAKEREKQRARELEHAREIEKAYHQLEESHETLKATQAQLIQSEKMASLGELTAGIAHEIQNPLNFVNNFAELNQELLREMKEELAAGRNADAAAIADDVMANEAKIAEHGKRADAIVKNMLLHSRAAAGEKELTDLNALADEYLHLSYHGLRAKDKSFNASLETNFDPTLPMVPMVAQDIGRLLLNLFNNAFYAVREKQKTAGPGYQPTVSVKTTKLENVVEIMVSDNGTGIPEAVRDKIFQPFFTTKPTGQGTGLGLSLGYDIVKAHGGEIHIDTKEGEFTRFRVVLPVG
jgi:signal transduction histidine kinase/ligand-binding sensor domain-containing protein